MLLMSKETSSCFVFLRLNNMSERKANMNLREMTEIKELTPTLINSLTAVGMIDIPTEQEILAMMKEIRANPQEFRFVA